MTMIVPTKKSTSAVTSCLGVLIRDSWRFALILAPSGGRRNARIIIPSHDRSPRRRRTDRPGARRGHRLRRPHLGAGDPGRRARGARLERTPGHRRRRDRSRSEEHTSELQSQSNLVCRLLLEKKKKQVHQPKNLWIALVQNQDQMLSR